MADSVELTEISRVTRKVKNIVLHKMMKGPDLVNATVALSHKGTYARSLALTQAWAHIDIRTHTMMS